MNAMVSVLSDPQLDSRQTTKSSAFATGTGCLFPILFLY